MNMVQKTSAQRLAGMALDLGASALRGVVVREDCGWKVGDTDVDEWLRKHAGRQIILIAAVLDEETEPPKTCGACGRDYVGDECPHCREARRRLRRA
jgi:hypothetical protein